MPDPQNTPGAVFLSYAHEDGEAARRIADALRAFGVEVWFDMSELRGGDAWDTKIRKQIRECALFVPIISANTQARGEGYFRREWRLAVERTYDMSDNRAYLVPVITDSTPEAAADVPEPFMKAHFTRLVGGVPTSQFIENVKRLLQSASAPGMRASPVVAAAPQATAAGPDPKSIAVLPFVNWSTDAEQGFFADGLSEELLNLLARVPELQVTSRSSAFSYKGKEIKIVQVARELNVANILEGSVRRSGNRLRITAQLIDARSDRHLWSRTFDRTMDDIFAVQDEISGAVVEQLKITLLGAVPKAKSYDPNAYALFLQARELERMMSPDSLEQAVALNKRALEIDPSIAAAWDSLGAVYLDQSDGGLRPNDEGYRLAREAVERAIKVDPNFALAHARLAQLVSVMDGDLAASARHLEHALKLEPSNYEILSEAVMMTRILGRLEESCTIARYCAAHDPVNSLAHGRLGGALVRLGRPEEAGDAYAASLRLAPGRVQASYGRAMMFLQLGRLEDAHDVIRLEPGKMWRLVGMTMVLHSLGRKADSDSALNELIRDCEREAAFNIAYAVGWRGEVDRAFEWLEKAVEYADPGMMDTPWQVGFELLRDDPRWMPFLRKIGKAPEQLAAIKFEVNLPAR